MQIRKGDIVEHKATGQTWKVLSTSEGTVRVVGNGRTEIFSLTEVRKAPDRPPREESKIAKR